VSRKKHDGLDRCISCAAKASINKKPQCSQLFWDDEQRKMDHGNVMKNSESYRTAIKNRPDISGANNSRFGVEVSDETRAKMSASRIGKLGENSTAWKGGRNSINKRVKKCQQTRYNWFGRVLQRANYKCQQCGNKAKDAHHIDPVCNLTRRLLAGTAWKNDDDAVAWLMEQHEIIDKNLENGMALCRECHMQAHKNWGSHLNP
jgi:hypothetical protein